MKKDFYETMNAKMAIKQGTLFRAFFINLILGAIVLGLCRTQKAEATS